MILSTLTLLAIVTQDQVPLRAAPRDSAAQQAVLTQGDNLEIRGVKMDYLQVYDHRRERSGYIRAQQVRTVQLEASQAPELLAVVRFLRDNPGQEALGIAYSAAYLRAVPAQNLNVEAFEALGIMAERLARRGSSRKAQSNDALVAAQLELASSYGVRMESFEREGRLQLCYNGEAFGRVLTLPASAEQRARAALALTRHDCVDPNLPPNSRASLDQWRADLLDRLDLTPLPAYQKNQVQLRRAGVWASLAFAQSRRGQPAQASAERALQALASINKNELAEADASAYTEAAVRVAAVRWAALPEGNVVASRTSLNLRTHAGSNPGETCVSLHDAQHDAQHALVSRCTYGLVWAASARAHPQQQALTLAVQPLDGWRELWVFRPSAQGWQVDVLPPDSNNPELGYLEFAGWVPGQAQMLAVREAKTNGRWQRRFEVINLNTLAVEQAADSPNALSRFYRWQDPQWKQQTLSLRW